MIDPTVREYVELQTKQGKSRSEITSALMSSGWQLVAIEDLFAQLYPPVAKATKNKLIALSVLTVLMLVIALVAVNYFFFQPKAALEPSQKLMPVEVAPIVTPTPSVAPTSTPSAQSTNPFYDQLISCTSAKMSFIHPITKETFTREITGLENDVCVVVETMPQGGVMTCKYPEATRTIVAAYYKKAEQAESMGISVSTNLATGEQSSTSELNAMPEDNPIQEALTTGTCQISGY